MNGGKGLSPGSLTMMGEVGNSRATTNYCFHFLQVCLLVVFFHDNQPMNYQKCWWIFCWSTNCSSSAQKRTREIYSLSVSLRLLFNKNINNHQTRRKSSLDTGVLTFLPSARLLFIYSLSHSVNSKYKEQEDSVSAPLCVKINHYFLMSHQSNFPNLQGYDMRWKRKQGCAKRNFTSLFSWWLHFLRLVDCKGLMSFCTGKKNSDFCFPDSVTSST